MQHATEKLGPGFLLASLCVFSFTFGFVALQQARNMLEWLLRLKLVVRVSRYFPLQYPGWPGCSGPCLALSGCPLQGCPPLQAEEAQLSCDTAVWALPPGSTNRTISTISSNLHSRNQPLFHLLSHSWAIGKLFKLATLLSTFVLSLLLFWHRHRGIALHWLLLCPSELQESTKQL